MLGYAVVSEEARALCERVWQRRRSNRGRKMAGLPDHRPLQAGAGLFIVRAGHQSRGPCPNRKGAALRLEPPPLGARDGQHGALFIAGSGQLGDLVNCILLHRAGGRGHHRDTHLLSRHVEYK